MDDDLQDMACAECRSALSARTDGEDPTVEPSLLDAHLDACPGCRAHAHQLGSLRRRSAVAEAPAMADLAPRVARLNATADRGSHSLLVRLSLAAVGVIVLVVAVPSLFLGHDHGGGGHEARHLGAFSVAYAVALLVVVVRPARARTVLPVTVVLAGALMVTAVIDAANGEIPLVDEAAHLPELISVGLVWWLARGVVAGEGAAGGAARSAEASLRLVADEPDDRPLDGRA